MGISGPNGIKKEEITRQLSAFNEYRTINVRYCVALTKLQAKLTDTVQSFTGMLKCLLQIFGIFKSL